MADIIKLIIIINGFIERFVITFLISAKVNTEKYFKKQNVSPSIFFDRLAGNLPPIKFQINNKGLKVKPITLSKVS